MQRRKRDVKKTKSGFGKSKGGGSSEDKMGAENIPLPAFLNLDDISNLELRFYEVQELKKHTLFPKFRKTTYIVHNNEGKEIVHRTTLQLQKPMTRKGVPKKKRKINTSRRKYRAREIKPIKSQFRITHAPVSNPYVLQHHETQPMMEAKQVTTGVRGSKPQRIIKMPEVVSEVEFLIAPFLGAGITPARYSMRLPPSLTLNETYRIKIVCSKRGRHYLCISNQVYELKYKLEHEVVQSDTRTLDLTVKIVPSPTRHRHHYPPQMYAKFVVKTPRTVSRKFRQEGKNERTKFDTVWYSNFFAITTVQSPEEIQFWKRFNREIRPFAQRIDNRMTPASSSTSGVRNPTTPNMNMHLVSATPNQTPAMRPATLPTPLQQQQQQQFVRVPTAGQFGHRFLIGGGGVQGMTGSPATFFHHGSGQPMMVQPSPPKKRLYVRDLSLFNELQNHPPPPPPPPPKFMMESKEEEGEEDGTEREDDIKRKEDDTHSVLPGVLNLSSESDVDQETQINVLEQRFGFQNDLDRLFSMHAHASHTEVATESGDSEDIGIGDLGGTGKRKRSDEDDDDEYERKLRKFS